MKRITMVGLFVGLLSLSMNAQFIQSSSSESGVRTTDVQNQNRPDASIQELLARYQSLGKQAGSISQFFTREEQRTLRTYFDNQESVSTPTFGERAIKDNSELARSLNVLAGSSLFYNQQLESSTNVGERTPKDNSEKARSLKASVGQYRAENPQNLYFNSPMYGSRSQGGENRQQFTVAEKPISAAYFGSQNTSNRAPQATLLSEGFDDITTLDGAGYSFINVSDVAGSTNWFQGNTTVFSSHSGAPTSYIGANYNSSAGSVVNNFMITPILNLKNGDEITFWSRTATSSSWPDRLEVRIDPTGTNTNPTGPTSVGSYTELLLSINPSLTVGGYPEVWTEYTATVSGLAAPIDTRVAFRYWVTNSGVNANFIGIDSLTITDGTGGGGPFPDPYCSVAYTSNVEPITLVEVAGISNRTSGVVNGSPALEDFTAIFGDMEEDGSYPIALEGNTDGGFTNSFTVFIDWNQDGILDNASERYEIGTIVGSTGNDGTQATGTITVPSGVTEGPTRMRVIKKFLGAYATDSCTPGSGYGQAEDYSINVTLAGGGGGTACAQTHPYSTPTGASGSSVDSDFKTASDIVVTAGENFTLNTIEVPFLTFAPEDPPTTATVVYYADNAGFPGTVLNTETVVPTIVNSEPWSANPVAYQFKTSLAMTPFTFNGDASVDKTYWIEISMGTATNQATVFWEFTDDIPVEGSPMVQLDETLGTWSIPNPIQEVIYTYSGDCEAIGTGGAACAQTHPYSTPTGASGSSVDSDFKTASDIVVAAGENFTLETIEVPFLTYAPEDAPTTATVVYYADNAGFPGTVLNTETVVPTIVNSEPWVNPVAYQFKTSLAMTPFTFNGDASVDKTYWIEISMGTATNQATVFWEYTDDIPVEGNPMVQLDASVGTWSIPDPTREVIYTYSGECEAIGVNPTGPLTTVYGINNADQDLIGFGTADPQNAEIFGTSPITVNFENAGAIDPANPTTGYVLDNGGQFFSFDVTTGFYTSLGSIPGDWVGMEFDRATGIIYAVKGTSLYTIDPVGLTSTLVGSLGLNTGDLPVSLAIDGAGIGYVHELVSDLIYSVNLATGAATVVGATGFDANYGQGMCYDPTTDTVYLSAFNSTTFMAEWRSVDTTTGMTTLIAPITTVNDPAPQVAWASVGETLDPPTCPKPTFLTVTDITETTAVLNWVAEPNASNGYIWYVFNQGANPTTDTAVATGTTPAGTTTATANGLQNAMSYDFYVVADCNTDGLSAYAGPVTFATLITPPACGGKFYDTGGPTGDYGNNENVTTVISPDSAGDFVTVTFLSFNVEATWDALYVYDGPSASSPIISSGNPATNSGFPAGGYYGTNIPGPFSSTHSSGALTFVFRSESSFTYFGWEADVTCATFPPPNDKIVNSINVGDIGFPYTDPAVAMPAATTENGNPEGCDLTGANGVWYHFTTTGTGTASANIVTPGGASNVTFYTAPNENAVETDLSRVQQSTNPCNPGTSSSINLEANQTYYVFVMNSGAVTDIQIDANILGVSNNTLDGFTYYPNPTNGVLNLNSKSTIEMVSIYNMLGQKILDSSSRTTSATLDISALSNGTYIMKVTVNGKTGTYKLLKQ